MTSKELYKKYLETLNERHTLENKISAFIEKWKNGEAPLSTKSVEETIDKGYERLENLKQLEQKLYQELISMEKSEKEKRYADISLKSKLGKAPSNITIVDGVLSSNANESHLIAEEKTTEQLEQEKNQMLTSIKLKIQSGELTFAEASKLVNNINTSYGFYDRQNIEKTNERHM